MGKKFTSLNADTRDFIEAQKIFFVGTAAAEGRVNVSPKGMDTLRVLDDNLLVWLNLTGSGNETAAHLRLLPRMTILFCAFEGKPMILRLYGTAKIFHPRDVSFGEYLGLFPNISGARQVVELSIDLVQTSCGFAVPLMEFKEERPTLSAWADRKGAEGIEAYWLEKNTKSIDGLETGILEDNA
ncbi:MAG: pyridoxamine 5'-phosphate oxidase family protein [Lunatimonas sp.]|uniref:pyridoxamine 5'-phosphate oxidase family protein n=1 Tax=Lunatimonas sp. TaxID=2060141 RepID=UPI00263B947C|nr:pyridoxamine 5'-phosphate oxidase family protein [Lunatimonas sp.]MCC5939757.1 pyridoxamine 5'-phosphate oxidase family protein [Lunatimonas sp.]